MSPNALLSPSHKAEGAVDPTLVSGPLLTPVGTAQAMQLNDASESSSTIPKQRDDKFPHDASVFVGSLPSNMDQGDLTRMLMDHLSGHTQIKNIKVVRDSKGGVCAFVQCENAVSATALIQTLHASSPKPFLGRILRYEPARAFRTLLVSYRTPTQFGSSPSPGHGQSELELPTTMRIWKHRNSRFHSILYNSDAIHTEENLTKNTVDVPWNSLFLHPLHFDEGSLRKLASYFGPLESFTPWETPDKIDFDQGERGQTPPNLYPIPHRCPRSAGMASGCWEIKWEHRDDCVSALMTLRRVPHLTVTWAHQPAPTVQAMPPSYQQSPISYSPQILNRCSNAPDTSTSQPTQVPFIVQGPRTNDNAGKGDAAEDAPRLVQEYPSETVQYSWTDDSVHGAREEKEISELSSVLRSPLIERNNSISDGLNHTQSRTSEIDHNDVSNGEPQEVYVPQTPALEKSSITPTTPGSYFPVTPIDSDLNNSRTTHRTGVDYKISRDAISNTRGPREIDPTTLFVGGLEMFGPGAWDEEKVKTFFSRFGGLEYVKVVRPLNACAAFAFVKFNNTEAPARAVSEEHNRIYEGRAMRVQLRDCNPPRNSWKFNRGRGRPQHQHFSAPRRPPQRSSFGYQTGPVFSANQEKILLDNPAKQSPLVLQNPPAVIRLPRDDRSLTPSLVDSSPLNVSPADAENYREWYDDADSSVNTPEPSSLGSSASTSGIPFSASPSYGYPVSNGPYFSHPPWFPPHMPYQIPYYPGYPVYPPMVQQHQHQALTGPSGSDHNAPTAGMQHNWPSMNMYTSYIPYPSVPSRAQLVEQGPQTSQIPTQAPVVPTGFIQNEQGTLIAVYQPDVLDQYLTGATSAVPITPNYLVPNQQRCELANSQPHEPGNIPVDPLPGHQNRPKLAGFQPPPSHQSTIPPRETNPSIPDTPLYRRHNDRREYQQGHGFARQQNHFRPGNNGRPPRVHRNYPITTHPSDLGHHISQPGVSGDWNR